MSLGGPPLHGLVDIALDDVDENPYNSAVTRNDMMTRASTREWLFRFENFMLAMTQRRGFRFENFMEYIRLVGTHDPDLRDNDGSLWIWVQTEHLSDLHLLRLLFTLWSMYHPYVYTAWKKWNELDRIRLTIEERCSEIALARTTISLMQAESNGINMDDERPARIPEPGDPCVEEDSSEDEEWQGLPQ